MTDAKRDEKRTIENAVIKSTMLGYEDRGILTAFIHVESDRRTEASQETESESMTDPNISDITDGILSLMKRLSDENAMLRGTPTITCPSCQQRWPGLNQENLRRLYDLCRSIEPEKPNEFLSEYAIRTIEHLQQETQP